MALTIVANIGYHFCQKSIGPQIHPLVSLAVTYGVALAATLLAIPFAGISGGASWSAFGQVNWASYGLGLAAVGLEVGFLLAYRAGWQVSVAALYSNMLVTVLLVPVGVFAFQEGIGLRKVLGFLFAIAGLWLLGTKS
jgi:hypothetical protein